MIYLDMDGVLCDFDKGLLDNYGVKNCLVTYGTADKDKTPEQWEISKRVWGCMNQEGFFRNLPPMEGFRDLYKVASELSSVYILTAFPSGDNTDRVGEEKEAWLKEFLPEIDNNHFIFCRREDKASYAWQGHRPNQKGAGGQGWVGDSNVLIDDLELNCQEWEKGEGIGILFKNSNQAVEDLKKVFNVN